MSKSWKKISTQWCILVGLMMCAGAQISAVAFPLNKVEVSMHMVLPVESEGRYYITGTTDLTNVWKGKTDGFTVYSSKDLKVVGQAAGSCAWLEAKKTILHASEVPLEANGTAVPGAPSSFPRRTSTSWWEPSILPKERRKNKILTMEADKPEGPYELEPRNIALDFWHEGPEATLDDFELSVYDRPCHSQQSTADAFRVDRWCRRLRSRAF